MGEHRIEALVNPLILFGAEFRPGGLNTEDASYASMMGFLCCPGTDSQIAALVERYNKISVEKNRLPIAPNERALVERLIWPLRHAKASYVIGNFLGAIALSGLVAEMSAILTFDLHNEAHDPPRYDKAKQEDLFGRRFEKLGQERRVKVLRSLGLVAKDTIDAFEIIRDRRNRYLHLWSEPHGALAEDAVQCFDASLTIVVNTLGMRLDAGKLSLRDEVFTYLNKHGVATPWQPPEAFLSASDQLDEVDPTDEVS